jgi:hypothetical protein
MTDDENWIRLHAATRDVLVFLELSARAVDLERRCDGSDCGPADRLSMKRASRCPPGVVTQPVTENEKADSPAGLQPTRESAVSVAGVPLTEEEMNLAVRSPSDIRLGAKPCAICRCGARAGLCTTASLPRELDSDAGQANVTEGSHSPEGRALLITASETEISVLPDRAGGETTLPSSTSDALGSAADSGNGNG